MARKKNIKLMYGCGKKLAIICGVSENTVTNAIHWKFDSEKERLVRRKAVEMDMIKRY